MFVVISNVLVYADDESAAEHARCRALVEAWRRRSGAWYITWGICYEFLRIVTARVMRHPWTVAAGVGFLQALQQSRASGCWCRPSVTRRYWLTW